MPGTSGGTEKAEGGRQDRPRREEGGAGGGVDEKKGKRKGERRGEEG